MNTTTNRRFVLVLRLLLAAFVVTFVVYSIATYESPAKKMDSLWDTAQALTDEADQLAKADYPQAGQAYLSAARAWQEFLEYLKYISNDRSLSRKESRDIDNSKVMSLHGNVGFIDPIENCLMKAKEHGADAIEVERMMDDACQTISEIKKE